MTIAVAHNDSAEGRAALLHAAREAIFQHTSMAVLHILGRQQTEGDPAIAALRVEIEQALHSAGLEDLEWDLHTAPDESGKAAALVELTNEVGAVLLVVGSRRRTPIGKFLLGSTVQRVVLDSPVAVLVVKAPLG
ncbi:MAG: universal stress protein, partial [Propionibacteriaceae bacterium]|nr:universal stress protein [Propionibacteriaceae bacterium]